MIHSDAHVNVAVTFQLVAVAGLYVTVAVGAVLSIQFTVAVVSPVFPAASSNSNVNVQSAVNIYVSLAQLFVIVIHSDAHVNVAVTSPVVKLLGS